MATMAPEPGTQEPPRMALNQFPPVRSCFAPAGMLLCETGRSAVITMLHMIAGEARIYRAARRAALGDGMRGARSRLVRKVSVGPDVRGHGAGAPLLHARIGLLCAGNRRQ